MKTLLSLALLLSIAIVSPARSNDKVGSAYPGWKKGEIDIHHIYTGRGEANFYIFPDGTSMLIDAGDHQASVPMTDPKPDLSRRAGEWVARYILRTNPSGSKVDYLMASHFHGDHTGSIDLDAPVTEGRNPDYKLVGIAEVGEHIQFGHIIDRGYPDYNYPVTISNKHTSNYLHFAKWHKKKYGAEQEAFKVGALNQIALQKRPGKYASLFSIRNLAASAEVWDPVQNTTTRYYDLNAKNTAGSGNENTKSIAFRIQYGPFSYFAGGDLSGSLLDAEGKSVNIEAKVGEMCGEVDVCKCNHHAYKDAMHPDFLRHIHAQAYVIPVWDQFHTQEGIISRMLNQEENTSLRNASPTMVLSQYIVAPARRKFAAEEWMQKTCPHDGHIVIKVYDKGRKYKIYRLSAENEDMIIQQIYGPFQSKGRPAI